MQRRTLLKIAAVALGSRSSALPRTASASLIDVPLYRQEHALTCEAASLRMALGGIGIDVAEGDILQQLPRDPTPRQVQPDGTVVWGDPDLGFVGEFDGVFARDGYGVYDGPIAVAGAAFGVNIAHSTATDPSTLYAAVSSGQPVIVWIPYGLTVKGRGEWLTPDGKTVPYVVTEHCVVLSGLTDSGVMYADPWEGILKTADYATFEAAFTELQNRAVFVSAGMLPNLPAR